MSEKQIYSERFIKSFLVEIVKIEQKYGTELRNSKTNRVEEVRQVVERFAQKAETETPEPRPARAGSRADRVSEIQNAMKRLSEQASDDAGVDTIDNEGQGRAD